jgi:transposase
VARRLFDKLSLGSILDAGHSPLRHGQPLSERIFPLVANRLSRPGSEHALAQWLEDFYVCNPEGSRWAPVWKQSRRVKVGFDQLKLWYQSLDDLLAQKTRIEKEVYRELRNLFSLQPDLAFYDITSTYFEGNGPEKLGRFGYSRDGKPRNRQVVIGVVMMEGWPIAHHVFAGNRLDQTTVVEVVQDLNQRFGLNRVVFVGDRGMMTIGNVEQLRKMKQGYLVGLQRRNRKDTAEYIQQATARSDWQACPVGIAAAEKSVVPKTRVVEVAGKEPGVRVFVVHSQEREVYERGMRELSMERTRKDLEALQAQVKKGELKEPDKIGAAAATKLRRNHGHRYYDWELRKGEFHFFEHPVNLAREKALEGKYVIQTEEPNLSPVEAVTAYKELNEVERGFSHLKDLLELRPVYHHRDARVQAHVFVAALALLLDRALEKSLRAAGSRLSTPFVWQALEMIRCVEVDLGQRRKICVTRGNQHVAEVLRVLGITQLDPPAPPEAQPCLM